MDDQVHGVLRIGDYAPGFEVMTTTGKIQFSAFIKSHWTILSYHEK